MGKGNNLFKITFLISLAVHAVFFLPIPDIEKPKEIESKQVHLNFLALKIPVKKRIAKFRYKKVRRQNKQRFRDKTLAANSSKNSVIEKYDAIRQSQQAVNSTSNNSEAIKLQQKKQSLAAKNVTKNKELSKNKSYISYYKLINEQLRQAVIYPPHFSEGEIALSFVLSSDGKLENVEVMETATLENEILKETAMQIVKKASPFPPFPKNLNHKQLTFNIIFCFKESS